MKLTYLLAFLCLSLTTTAQSIRITGIIDGGLSGGTPKAVELYVTGTLDLDGYDLQVFSNANTEAGATTDLSGTYTDAFVYVLNNGNDDEFTATFGTEGDFGNRIIGGVSVNGDDKVTLNRGGEVIDQTGGVIGVQEALYRDGFLYRIDNTGPDGAWIAENWAGGGDEPLDDVPAEDYPTVVPFGSFSAGEATPTITAAGNGDLAEPATDGGFTVALSEAVAADLTVTYSLSGTASIDEDYTDPSGGTLTVNAGATSATLLLEVIDDEEAEFVEAIILTLTGASDERFTLGGPAAINLLDDEPMATTPIHAIQGGGDASPLAGQTVTIQGVVVGDYQGGNGEGLGGFFVQEEDVDADADPLTSEGIWVFENGTVDVAQGDLVTVTGEVEEFRGLTEIVASGAGASVTVDATGTTLPAAVALDLPFAAQSTYERFEGMRVRLVAEAVVTNTNDLERFGSYDVSIGERLAQFTECNEPDADALPPFTERQIAATLTVDDGRSGNFLTPIPLPDGQELSATNSLRAGTRITDLTGILDERFTGYRLQPLTGASLSNGDRPGVPEVGGDLRVVGMNVLNYFTTLDDRGAETAEELDRQEAKIVAAVCELDADVLGLVEIEDNGTGPGSAIDRLLAAIQAACGTRYAAVVSPEAESDNIKVQLIYKVSTVAPSGAAAALVMPGDLGRRNRNPVAQTFEVIEADNPGFGGRVTVVVNHFKSKGSDCGAGDDDPAGGAGNCDGTRTRAARVLLDWLATDPTGSGVAEQLIIGDLNSYRMEAPIATLLDGGFVNLVEQEASATDFPCGAPPSYVFRGRWGSLDYALGSASLAPLVTGAAPWNVNAAEPTALAYNAQLTDSGLFAPTPFRFSDHDPIVVGIAFSNGDPARVSDFAAAEREGEVDLTWRTTFERGTDRFEIERLDADGNYGTIASVPAAGNSSSGVDYQSIDREPLEGDNRYRLLVISDGDNSFVADSATVFVEGTNSVAVVRTGPMGYRLRDAPVGTFYVLTDSAGATLRGGRVTYETTDIDGAGLPAGVYFLALQLPRGTTRVFKLVFDR